MSYLFFIILECKSCSFEITLWKHFCFIDDVNALGPLLQEEMDFLFVCGNTYNTDVLDGD